MTTWHTRKAAQLLRRAAQQTVPSALRHYAYQAARLADEVESDGVSNALAAEALDLAAAAEWQCPPRTGVGAAVQSFLDDLQLAAGLLLAE